MHAPDLKIIYIHSTNVCNTCPTDKRTNTITHISHTLVPRINSTPLTQSC